MKEKLKSVALILLIALSLYLTHQLWYGQLLAEESAEAVYERVVVENPRPLTQVLAPANILVSLDNTMYSLQESGPAFTYMWPELSGLLQELEYTVYPEPAPELDPPDACIHLYFQPYLPVGSEQPWVKGSPPELVDQILISCDGERGMLKMVLSENGGAVVLSLSAEVMEKIDALIAGLPLQELNSVAVLNSDAASVAASRNIVIKKPIVIPDQQLMMTSLELMPEDIDRELILKTFFINPGLVRTVEERDGGLLYTDGERGLRIIEHNLEYSFPLLESTQVNLSYTEALNSSSSYLSYHGGWTPNLRLESLNPGIRMGNRYYQAQWRMYFEGYPAYSRRPVIAIFNDRGLLNYNRSIYKPISIVIEPDTEDDDDLGPDIETAPWQEALREALLLRDLERSTAQDSVVLEDLHLGYAVTGTTATIRALPVWVIKIDGMRFLLQADNLSLITVEDLL